MKKYPYLRTFYEFDGFALSQLPMIERCIKLGNNEEPEDLILILPRKIPWEWQEEYRPSYGIVTQGSSNMTIQLPSQDGIRYELGDRDKVWDSKIEIWFV